MEIEAPNARKQSRVDPARLAKRFERECKIIEVIDAPSLQEFQERIGRSNWPRRFGAQQFQSCDGVIGVVQIGFINLGQPVKAKSAVRRLAAANVQSGPAPSRLW